VVAGEIPNVRLTLSSRPESVVIVRQVLTGLAATIGLGALELNEINTAVSEAANNVVLHAYGGGDGPLEVDMCCRRGGLCVAVRDRGCGMTATQHATERPPSGDGLGLGLPVIRALAHEVELNAVAGGGTEVWMAFASARPHTMREPPQGDGLTETIHAFSSPLAGGATLAVAPVTLARAVVPRVVSALAARAQLSIGRISDALLLADALVLHTDDSLSSSHLNVEVDVAPRELHVRVGPLHPGHASALAADLTTEGLGGVLTRLADSHRIVVGHTGCSEMLALRLDARR
jgi:anti-sigma regulatory factor (Ser/Thr protein kinase)